MGLLFHLWQPGRTDSSRYTWSQCLAGIPIQFYITLLGLLVILVLNCLAGVFTLETSLILEWIFTVGHFIIGHIHFFGDMPHAIVPSVYCLSACCLAFKATNRCKGLQAEVACWTICFAFFFPMLLCSSTSVASLLRVLCNLSILSIFCVCLFLCRLSGHFI